MSTVIRGIYLITNTKNNKQYVGQSKNIQQRIKEHQKGSCSKVSRAIRRFGYKNFTFEILENIPVGDLDDKEQYWIAKLGTYPNGYNCTAGGCGVKHTSQWLEYFKNERIDLPMGAVVAFPKERIINEVNIPNDKVILQTASSVRQEIKYLECCLQNVINHIISKNVIKTAITKGYSGVTIYIQTNDKNERVIKVSKVLFDTPEKSIAMKIVPIYSESTSDILKYIANYFEKREYIIKWPEDISDGFQFFW